MGNNKSIDGPSEDALLSALKQNWEHARQEAHYRNSYFSFFWVGSGAAISFLLTKIPSTAENIFAQPILHLLKLYGLIAVFFALAAIFVLFAIVKGNLEFANHIKAVQWIAEKLNLNEYNPKDTKEFKGFMALPLPLKIPRVHRIFEATMYFAILVWGFWTFVYLFLIIGLINCLGLTSVILMSLAGDLLIVLLCFFLARKQYKDAYGITEKRRPEGIIGDY
ncbi:MAG TPA: hypothetical protein VJ165_00840 [candidate division Zixibacteria bacterium]|nr:hypothetical protein [candidate division Zixibacteria bacterium]